jgi:hypothetical protein
MKYHDPSHSKESEAATSLTHEAHGVVFQISLADFSDVPRALAHSGLPLYDSGRDGPCPFPARSS